MANLIRPVHVGVDAIMEGFDNLSKAGEQVFAVWYGDRDIAFQCSMDEATQRDILQSNLEALERSGNCDVLYLKMYPASVNGWIDTKTKAVSNTPIQVCEYKGAITGLPTDNQPRPAGMSYEAWEMLKQIKDMPDTIQTKIDAAVEAKLNEILGPEEPEEDQMTKIVNTINGLTQNPQVMSVIGALIGQLGGLFNRVAPVAQSRIGMVEPPLMPEVQQQAQPQRIPFNEDDMNNALDVLSYHCDLGACLQKLAAIAQQDPGKFKMLLGMLMNA